MLFTYDYTLHDGDTFRSARLSVSAEAGERGELGPNQLLTIWRDQPERIALIDSPADGLAPRAFGDIASVTITLAGR